MQPLWPQSCILQLIHMSRSMMLEHMNHAWFNENKTVNHHLVHKKLKDASFGYDYDPQMVAPWVARLHSVA